MSNQSRTPHLTRLEIGRTLRRLREERGMTPSAASQYMSYSRQTLTKIEAGGQSTRKEQIKGICEIYNAPAEMVSYLCGLAAASKEPGFWESHKDGVIRKFSLFIESEQTCTGMQIVEHDRIPGLLQTRDYVTALLEAQPEPVNPRVVDSLTAVRHERFERLMKRMPKPKVQILLGQSALTTVEALPQSVEQIKRIHHAAKDPRFDIRISKPFNATMGAPFTIMAPDSRGFGQGAPFVYLDTLDGCRYEDRPATVEKYQETFTVAFNVATSLEDYLNEHDMAQKQSQWSHWK